MASLQAFSTLIFKYADIISSDIVSYIFSNLMMIVDQRNVLSIISRRDHDQRIFSLQYM